MPKSQRKERFSGTRCYRIFGFAKGTIHAAGDAERMAGRHQHGRKHHRCFGQTLPENGKANAAVRAQLAKGGGIAKTRLTQLRGAKSRDKMFRLKA